MNDTEYRTLKLFSALFFLCAGLLFLWGSHTDGQFGIATAAAPQTVSQLPSWYGPPSNSERIFHALLRLFLPFAAVFVYIAPALIAQQRNHRERKPILILNLLLGWTVLGWVAALIWSYTSQVEEAEVAK